MKESSEDYPFILERLSETVRVIECADHHQWIVQRFVGNRWRSEAFFRTRKALIGEVQRRGLEGDGLLELPENFKPAYEDGQGVVVQFSRVTKQNETAESWPRLERLSGGV